MENENIDQIKDIKESISTISAIKSFADSKVGKTILDKKQENAANLINTLFKQLEDPNLNKIVSIIAELKYSLDDIICFCGLETVIERKQALLEIMLKEK
jgi:hypothetical protein